MTFWCQIFFGVDGYWVPDHSPEWATLSSWLGHSSGNPPIQVYQHTDAWQTHKVVFWFQFGHHDGKTKQFLMVKSLSLSAYNSILAMEAWWMPVLESPTNLGQMRKKPKGLCTWHALILHDPGNVQTWAETLLLYPVIPFFLWCGAVSLILKAQNYFGWHRFYFLHSLFSCFWGHKNLQSCKIMYWMTFISFIFNFPWDLNNTACTKRGGDP